MATRSILPNSSPEILLPMVGKHGTLQVRWQEEMGSHGLFYQAVKDGSWRFLAGHHNGYSCANLGKRIIAAWAGDVEAEYAMRQHDYILACGGHAISASFLKDILARGEG